MLSHGDALCVDDLEYQAFRQQVRSAQWQTAFLAKPLAERQAIALGIRQASAARKQDATVYADVDSAAAQALLARHQAQHLVHGHTHKPAQHHLGPLAMRTVLSDWDVNAVPARAEVLRLSASTHAAAILERLSLAAVVP